MYINIILESSFYLIGFIFVFLLHGIIYISLVESAEIMAKFDIICPNVSSHILSFVTSIIGIFQLIYIFPVVYILKIKHQIGVMYGVIIGALITVLLNYIFWLNPSWLSAYIVHN